MTSFDEYSDLTKHLSTIYFWSFLSKSSAVIAFFFIALPPWFLWFLSSYISFSILLLFFLNCFWVMKVSHILSIIFISKLGFYFSFWYLPWIIYLTDGYKIFSFYFYGRLVFKDKNLFLLAELLLKQLFSSILFYFILLFLERDILFEPFSRVPYSNFLLLFFLMFSRFI